jgi:hypothetical protein
VAEARPISAYLHQKRRDWEKQQKKFKKVANNNVPVLFASSEGLFLRLVDDNFGGAFNDHKHKDILDDSIKAQWSVEPKFVMEMCDLQLPKSAVRGRTPASRGGDYNVNHVDMDDAAFGTTVTVIVGKREPNLKSSLKKPRPQPSTPEVDEGFIDETLQLEHKKIVQFKTQIDEIPTLESKSSSNSSSHGYRPDTSAKLPPIVGKTPSPIKKSLNRKVSRTLSQEDSSPRKSSRNKLRHDTESQEDQHLLLRYLELS